MCSLGAASGKLRALAVASPGRSALLAMVPTMAEAGLGGVEMDSWFGLLVPAGTPASLVAQLNDDLRRAAGSDDVGQQFARLGFERAIGTPDAFLKLMLDERVRITRVIREAKIKAE